VQLAGYVQHRIPIRLNLLVQKYLFDLRTTAEKVVEQLFVSFLTLVVFVILEVLLLFLTNLIYYHMDQVPKHFFHQINAHCLNHKLDPFHIPIKS